MLFEWSNAHFFVPVNPHTETDASIGRMIFKPTHKASLSIALQSYNSLSPFSVATHTYWDQEMFPHIYVFGSLCPLKNDLETPHIDIHNTWTLLVVWFGLVRWASWNQFSSEQ